MKAGWLGIVLALAVLPAACRGVEPVGLESPALPASLSATPRQQLTIPSPGGDMPAALYLPQGEGPFPLAIVNHGSDQELAARMRMGMPHYPELTSWLLAREYAVLLPLRPGHGKARGRYLEDQRGCHRADYYGSGLATASLIEAAIGHMRNSPLIRQDGMLIVGASAGGWGAIALASRNPAAVRAYVSFSGGRGGRNRGRAGENCAPERLIAAAARYGAGARIPGLWLYAENDSWFPPELSRSLGQAYRAGGAPLAFELLPPSPGEGHLLVREPAARWAPALERFLSQN